MLAVGVVAELSSLAASKMTRSCVYGVFHFSQDTQLYVHKGLGPNLNVQMSAVVRSRLYAVTDAGDVEEDSVG